MLGDEEVVDHVPIDDDESLYTTPTRTIVHREGTFLRDESVEEFSNDVDRLVANEGRRKTKLTFEYGPSDTREFAVSNNTAESVLPTVLAGVLRATGTLRNDETVIQSYRFSELTVVVTTKRLFKHVGAAVWDEDYEAFSYEPVTGLRTEDGSVATRIVLEMADGTERLKVPQEAARSLREHLERAICAFHDVESIAALRARAGEGGDVETDDAPLSDDLEPLRAEADGETTTAEPTDTEGAAEFDDSPFEPPEHVEDSVEEQLAELREALEHQRDLLEEHTVLLERIERALTRDR